MHGALILDVHVPDRRKRRVKALKRVSDITIPWGMGGDSVPM